MRVIVTGSRGFLGAEFVKHLKKHKHDVVECDLILGHDITDKKTLESLFTKDVNCCVHLAAVSNLNIFDDDEKKGKDINVLGTNNIMDLCLQSGIMLYTASTCCLYGDNNLQVSYETSKVSPTEAYAVSKLNCEYLSAKFNRIAKKNQFICMRLATFYGGRYAREALCISKFIKIMMEKNREDRVLKIHGDGSMARTYTHVNDMVTGIYTLIVHGNSNKLPYTIYNVTREHSYSVWDIIKEISQHEDVYPEFSIEMVRNRPRPFSQCIIKSDRLKNIGWKPKYSWKDGIKEAIESFKRNGNKWLK